MFLFDFAIDFLIFTPKMVSVCLNSPYWASTHGSAGESTCGCGVRGRIACTTRPHSAGGRCSECTRSLLTQYVVIVEDKGKFNMMEDLLQEWPIKKSTQFIYIFIKKSLTQFNCYYFRANDFYVDIIQLFLHTYLRKSISQPQLNNDCLQLHSSYSTRYLESRTHTKIKT